ncbi:28066_t:CDS:2 [Gigaspora margarita]|uniref:28066_t:CDS:1 n=1 Tax=Gigaspora margarita TaxID=4874 RepID=A0ABN7VVF6_GIGMA|nr:28066_t:CDS:2 [Gigaspora margarita]
MEVYATKRRKDNARKAVEVSDLLEEENVEAKNNEEPKKNRSSGCVVSASFLKKAEILIDHPSTVMIIGIYTIVTEAANYATIVENDWMRKARARLDWEASNICDQILRKVKLKKIKEKIGNKDVDESSGKSEEEEKTGSDNENLEDWTICLLEETKNESETFNLEEITKVQKGQMQELLDKY